MNLLATFRGSSSPSSRSSHSLSKEGCRIVFIFAKIFSVVLTAKLVKEFNKTPFPLSVKIAMGGKLGKAQNTYVVSGGQAGGSRVSGAMEEYLEDRRHSESDLNYSGGALRPKLLFKVSAKESSP